MNKFYKIVFTLTFGMLVATAMFAGNPDRAGQAGATQLLINPWPNSSGQGGANMGSISGVESMSLNPAGILSIRNSEFEVSHALWLGNTGVSINSFGFCDRIGKDKNNAIGISITSFDFGNIPLTTELQPENSGQTFTISMLNIAFDYAHRFSDNITAGFLVRGVSEGITNLQAQGIALDAGIKYVAGESDRYHFGVALRNVGPAMNYAGDGLTAAGVLDGSTIDTKLGKLSQSYEMPSLLCASGGYDIIVPDSAIKNTLSANLSFTSNSFSQDLFALGLEFSYRSFLKLRAGFVYEDGIFAAATTSTAFAGPCGGISVDIPFGKDKGNKDKAKRLAVEYSYRAAAQFGGTHTFGLKLSM